MVKTKKQCKITRSEFAEIISNTEKKIGSRMSQSDIEAIMKGMIKAGMLKSCPTKK